MGSKRGWHHTPEFRKRLSDDRKGKGNPQWGKHTNLGRVFTEEHKKNISKNHHDVSGENNPMWGKRGELNPNFRGLTPLLDLIRRSSFYIKWRSLVLQRDKWICQTCGVSGELLEVHHKIRFLHLIEEGNIKTLEDAYKYKPLWDINNGVALCKKCHNLTKHRGNECKK